MQDTDRIRECDKEPEDSWNRLRGILKEIFAELGRGEAYLRAERSNFQSMNVEQKAPSAAPAPAADQTPAHKDAP